MAQDNRPPAFMFYVNDFSADEKVEAMRTEAVGCYILLLCKAWRATPPATLPADDSLLARFARVSDERWLELRSEVMAPFVLGTDGRLVQKRLRKEFDKQRARSRERSASGRKGNAKRWHSDSLSDRSAIAKESESVIETENKDSTLVESEDSAPLPNPVLEVFAHYRTYHPKAFRSPVKTSKEWKLIAARLKEGFSVEDLKLAIDGNHVSPFHCGENQGGKEYHGLELIVRDGSKVNGFIGDAKSRGKPHLGEKTKRTLRAADEFLRSELGDDYDAAK